MKFDKHEIKILKTSRPLIIEVGAHYGEDSMKFLKYFRDARLYCFEPDPRNIFVFKKHIEDERVTLIEAAVSDSNSQNVDFYQCYLADFDADKMLKKYHWISEDDYIGLNLNRSGASSLKRGHPAVADAEVIKVDTVRLDTWARQQGISHIDMLWIDVQGAERQVIEGAEGILRNVDYIWIEYGETEYEGGMTRQETIDLLGDSFEVFKENTRRFKKGDLLFRNTGL